jgi:hypothetical protein
MQFQILQRRVSPLELQAKCIVTAGRAWVITDRSGEKMVLLGV